MIKILLRVPPYLRSRRQKRAQDAAKEKNDPAFGSILDPATKDEGNKAKPKKRPVSPQTMHKFNGLTNFPDNQRDGGTRGAVIRRADTNSIMNKRKRCFLLNGDHKLGTWQKFLAKSSEDKLKFVRDRKLCEKFLSYTHFANCCKSPRGCSIGQRAITRQRMESLHDALFASFRRKEEASRVTQDLALILATVLCKRKGHTL